MNLKHMRILMTVCVAANLYNPIVSGDTIEQQIRQVESENASCASLELSLREAIAVCEKTTSATVIDPSVDPTVRDLRTEVGTLLSSAKNSLNGTSIAYGGLRIGSVTSANVDAVNTRKGEIRNQRSLVLSQMLLAYLDYQDSFNVEGHDHTTDVALVSEFQGKFRLFNPKTLWTLLGQKTGKASDGKKAPRKTDWPTWYVTTYLPAVIAAAVPADLDLIESYVREIGDERTEKATLLATITAKR